MEKRAIGLPLTVTHKTGSSSTTYYYLTNVQGDIVAIVDSNGATVATYSYDAWGNPLSTPTGTIATLNPLRYRGYIWDAETELYYLQSRYYSPELGRFISPDVTGVLTLTPMSLTDKNLFAYCDNNPVMRVDLGGNFWDIFLDVVSFGYSLYEVIKDPTDATAWLGLAGDTLDLIPGVTGVGEVTRAVSTVDNVTDAVRIADVAKTTNTVEDALSVSVDGIIYSEKVLDQIDNASDLYHSFPIIVDTFIETTQATIIKGGDGMNYLLFEIPGSINGESGFFEYIIRPNGECNHRLFKKDR